MTTLDTTVTQTITKLHGSVGRDTVNILDGAITASATSLDVVYTPSVDLAAGSVIEIGYEQMLVMAVSTNTLTIIRGWADTTATTHADGDVVVVEPRFSRQQVLNAVADEIRSLPVSIYKIDYAQVTWPADTLQVEADLTRPYRLLQARRTSGDYVGTEVHVELRNDADEYNSGVALLLRDGLFPSATTLTIVYARELETTALTSSSDLEEVGLKETVWDVLPLGAGSRLLLDTDALRADFHRQDQPRAAEEVPPEMIAKTAARWRMEAERRLAQEVTRSLERYGYRESHG